jgi:hypothetical protein
MERRTVAVTACKVKLQLLHRVLPRLNWFWIFRIELARHSFVDFSRIDRETRDFVACDGEMVIEANRAAGKCSGYLDSNDSLAVAFL